MTYANPIDIVNQLSTETEKLFQELQQEVQNSTLDVESALNKLKKFSEKVGEVTGTFLLNLCNSTEPKAGDESFVVLQNIQTWVKDTAIALVKFRASGDVLEQGSIPPYPRK